MHPVTAAELPTIPGHNELVRGEVRPVTLPGHRHAEIARRLTLIVGSYVEQHDLGVFYGSEVGYWIERNPDTVRGPDCSFLRRERVAQVGCPVGFVKAAPDLAIEIVSPNDRPRDVAGKARMWVATGAVMAMVFDPAARRVTVHTAAGVRQLDAGSELDFGELIPGLRIPLARVFP
jgi:Uma2 family endonuclease